MIPARTAARAVPASGRVTWSRAWADARGRPATGGHVRLAPVSVPGAVPAPVVVPIVNGVSASPLAPGTYRLTGQVVTVDGETAGLPPESITVRPL